MASSCCRLGGTGKAFGAWLSRLWMVLHGLHGSASQKDHVASERRSCFIGYPGCA